MTAQHTPTPYSISKRPNGLCDIRRYSHFDGDKMESVFAIIASDMNEHTAAFIVKACNAHEPLVAAVRCSQALDILNGGYPAEIREEAFSTLEAYGWARGGLTTYQAFVDGMQREALKLAGAA